MTVFLDTETTGLSFQLGDRIVEIAIVDEQGNTLFQSLLNPEIPIPFRAQQVHHISDRMVAGMPRLEDVLPAVHSAIEGQNVVIFNSPFDVGFFPCRLNGAAEVSCAMARFNQKYGGRNSLAYAARIVGHVWTGEAHRALADALACRSVWLHLENANSVSDELVPTFPIQDEVVATTDSINVSTASELVDRILEWSNSLHGSDEFDASFVRSVETQIESGRKISAKQVDALWNIVERWKVP